MGRINQSRRIEVNPRRGPIHALAWVISLGLLGPQIPVLAQRALNFRVFRAADGLYESTATSVSANAREHVWVRHGNAPVITRFDGYEFTTFPAPEGLGGGIQESPEGRVWFASTRGLQEFRDGQWFPHRIPELESESATNILRQIRPVPILPVVSNRVFLLPWDRLLEFQAETATVTTLLRSEQLGLGRFIALSADEAGGLWIVGELGVAKAMRDDRDSTWTAREVFRAATLSLQNLNHPIGDAEGGLTLVGDLIGTADRAVLHLDAKGAQPRLLGTGRFRYGWRGPDQVFWSHTIDALYQWQGTHWNKVETEGILAGQFHDVAVGSQGMFWLATSEGLVRFAPLLWRQPLEMAPVDSPVYTLLETPPNRLWLLTPQTLLLHADERWTSYPLPEELDTPANPANRLFLTGEGCLGLSTRTRLLWLDPKTGVFNTIRTPEGRDLQSLGQFRDRVFCLQVNSGSEATPDYQLVLHDGKRFMPFPDEMPPRRLGAALHFLQVTANGDVWLGGSAGVGRLRDHRWQVYGKADGPVPENATSMLETRSGSLWFGTPNKIHEFNGKSWSVLRSGFDRVYAMLEDKDASVWVASGSGLVRYYRDSWMIHGLEEGLPSEAIYNVIKDRNGELWVGTARGISRLHSDTDTEPPRAQVTTEKGPLALLEPAILTLTFQGIDKWRATPSSRLMFSHRLDSEPWTPYRPVSAASYDKLRAGPHRFELKAMDRNWNESPLVATYEFNVRLPWYREARLVAISMVGFIIIILLAALAVNRHLRLKRSYAEVERIVRQRTLELDQAQQALLHSQKMRALGTLAAGIAHDFNSILSIIKGSAQIIENHLDDPEKIRTRIDRIKTGVAQGSAIVKAMLGYGQAARQELSPLEINPIVEQTTKLLDGHLADHAQIRFEPAPNLPRIIIAKDLLQQMLLNILNNAAESMTKPGEIVLRTGRVEAMPSGMVLPAAPAPGYVTVSVQDSGSGIPANNLNRIFEPFFTTKAMSTKRGTGLGLSMVFEFAKDQGCGLKVESVVGQGSTFFIFIPAQG